LRFQKEGDIAIINQDYPNSVKIGGLGRGKKQFYSTQNIADCYADKDNVMLGSDIIISTQKLQLRGRHNLQNACAAALAANAVGIRHDNIKNALSAFKGLEHRLEFVAEKNGIKFYNDSFSTTPETAIAAIEAFDEPEIIILGGSSKNSDFTRLGQAIAGKNNIKAMILIGQEASRIKQATEGFKGQVLEGAKSMAEIIGQAASVAVSGDVIVLSPACASFDMFKSYVDRGEQFKAEVNRL
jgi:UDP-N-acetylmuramoylalanine--D-glutamate ligase